MEHITRASLVLRVAFVILSIIIFPVRLLAADEIITSVNFSNATVPIGGDLVVTVEVTPPPDEHLVGVRMWLLDLYGNKIEIDKPYNTLTGYVLLNTANGAHIGYWYLRVWVFTQSDSSLPIYMFNLTNKYVFVYDPAVNKPVANAGPDWLAPEGALVRLDGSQSYDPDGTVVSYLWEQASGIPVTLSDASTMYPYFYAPLIDSNEEMLCFLLTVTDDNLIQDSDICVVFVQKTEDQYQENIKPVANCHRRLRSLQRWRYKRLQSEAADIGVGIGG